MKQDSPQQCRVSVILPVYNHERWVRQAIDSVVAQSFRDWELLIIDDASTDHSAQIVSQHLTHLQDSRIRYWQHAQNQGAPDTLNEGMMHAKGDYFAILNSDDVWEAQRLLHLFAHAEQNASDFLATGVFLLDADSQAKEAQEPHWVAWYNTLKQDFATHGDWWASLLRGNFFVTTSNFFFHRRVYEQVGLFRDLRYVHDYDYVLRVLNQGLQLAFLPDVALLGYRLHDTNTIREKPLAAIEENMMLLLAALPHWGMAWNALRVQGLQTQLQDLYRYTREEWLTTVHNERQAVENSLWPLIADRDAWIQDRDDWIVERDQTIRALQNDQQQWQQWVHDRDQWIAQRDEQICQLQQLTHQQQQWIMDRDQWIAQRDTWLNERNQLIQHLQQQQFELRNSRAFRLGECLLAPLRRVRQFLMRVTYA